jgi:hypothetical protein
VEQLTRTGVFPVAWRGAIDTILEEGKQCPKKQRCMVKRIFERLRAEHDYLGGYVFAKLHL